MSRVERIGIYQLSKQIGVSRQALTKTMQKTKSRGTMSRHFFNQLSEVFNEVSDPFDRMRKVDLKPLFLEWVKSERVEVSLEEFERIVVGYQELLQKYGEEKAELVAKLVLG